MRELHAIGLTPDGQHLLLAATPDATKASHRIVVDKRFEAVLRGQRVDETAASGPALSVSDMQTRLRAGASVEEVAAAAGLPVSRVERFAGPILSEREETLRKVFDAVQVGRRGTSTVALGRAVAIALDDLPNARLDTVEWTAYKKADGVWVAAVTVLARGRARRAEWSLDDTARTVKPLDAWASSLGHVDAQPKPSPEKAASARAARVAPKAAARRAGWAEAPPPAKLPARAATKAAAKRVAASAGKTPVVKAQPARKAPASKAPASKAPASKAPAGKAPAKQPSAARAAKATTSRATTSRATSATTKTAAAPVKAAAARKRAGSAAAAAATPARARPAKGVRRSGS